MTTASILRVNFTWLTGLRCDRSNNQNNFTTVLPNHVTPERCNPMLLGSTIKTRLKSLLRKHDLLRQCDPRHDLREYMASQAKVRVIVGASGGSYKDWI